MMAWKQHSFSQCAIFILLLVLCGQSSALARAAGFQRDPPFSSKRIDQLPSEVQSAVRHMCGARPTAANYFATYLENARIIKLHFEDLSCGEGQTYRTSDGCLREEFVRSGTHYRLFKAYYAQCGN